MNTTPQVSTTVETPTPRKSVTPMTIAAAARYLDRTTWAVYQLTERGRLPSAMLNGRRFVALEECEVSGHDHARIPRRLQRVSTRREQWVRQETNSVLSRLAEDLAELRPIASYGVRATLAAAFIAEAAERLGRMATPRGLALRT